jgi:hypothetical protein
MNEVLYTIIESVRSRRWVTESALTEEETAPEAAPAPAQSPAPQEETPADSHESPKFDRLIVPSKAHAALWEGELIGQMVDGAYMNRSDHKRWEGLQVEVDLSRKTPILITSVPKGLVGSFPFDQDVVPVVGDRMLKLVQSVDPSLGMDDVTRMCREFAVALKQPRGE